VSSSEGEKGAPTSMTTPKGSNGTKSTKKGKRRKPAPSVKTGGGGGLNAKKLPGNRENTGGAASYSCEKSKEGTALSPSHRGGRDR